MNKGLEGADRKEFFSNINMIDKKWVKEGFLTERGELYKKCLKFGGVLLFGVKNEYKFTFE